MSGWRLFLFWLVLDGLGGCAPDLTGPSEVVRPRILGVRIEAASDPTRASLAPSEQALVRFHIGHPQPSVLGSAILQAGAVLCVGQRSPAGRPLCFWEVPVDMVSQEVGPDEVQLALTVPSLETILAAAPLDLSQPSSEDGVAAVMEGAMADLWLLGAVCSGAGVERVQGLAAPVAPLHSLFRCQSAGEAVGLMPFSRTLVRAEDVAQGRVNHNPEFGCRSEDPLLGCAGPARADEPEVAGDVVWVRPPPEGEGPGSEAEIQLWEPFTGDLGASGGCADEVRSDLPQVSVGDEAHILRVRFDPGDRESLGEAGDSVFEDLFVYVAHTQEGGALNNYVDVLNSRTSSDTLEAEFSYEPPAPGSDFAEDLPPEGRLVRFSLAVHDGRGGSDFAWRTLCVTPAN